MRKMPAIKPDTTAPQYPSSCQPVRWPAAVESRTAAVAASLMQSVAAAVRVSEFAALANCRL